MISAEHPAARGGLPLHSGRSKAVSCRSALMLVVEREPAFVIGPTHAPCDHRTIVSCRSSSCNLLSFAARQRRMGCLAQRNMMPFGGRVILLVVCARHRYDSQKN
jgi:hypothetical protein